MFFKKVFNKLLAIRFIIKYKAKKVILINPKNIKVGKNIHFGIYVKIACYEKYATKQYFPTIEFGDNIYIGNFCSFLSASKLSIGDNSIIASYVLITNENHGSNLISDVPYKDQELITSDTLIGRNCWNVLKYSIS